MPIGLACSAFSSVCFVEHEHRICLGIEAAAVAPLTTLRTLKTNGFLSWETG